MFDLSHLPGPEKAPSIGNLSRVWVEPTSETHSDDSESPESQGSCQPAPKILSLHQNMLSVRITNCSVLLVMDYFIDLRIQQTEILCLVDVESSLLLLNSTGI